MNKPQTTGYLDMDFLKTLDPQWFGLGFIQVKLNEFERLHFWHPDLTSDVQEEELHDHRYDFTSTILRGTLTNEISTFTKAFSGSHELIETDCKANNEPVTIARGFPTILAFHTLREGDQYHMRADTFHRIRTSSAITHLKRTSTFKDKARVIKHPDDPFFCPFTNTIPKPQLLNYMEECIKGFPTSYHYNHIPKGTIHSLTKVEEEFLELKDAVLQNNSIMALVECADLIGAIELFAHPTTLEEIITMKNATKRAFISNDRL